MDCRMLEKEVLWVLKNYGSDAQERKQPGSKVIAQTERITEFIRQWEEANNILRKQNLDLISLKRTTEG